LSNWQLLINNPKVMEYRKNHFELKNLMKNGIFKDDGLGMECFTGYANKTPYIWGQYFEAIVHIFKGLSSEYISNEVVISWQNQLSTGFISSSVPGNEWHDNEHVKPFLST
jgi:hypothetical protein